MDCTDCLNHQTCFLHVVNVWRDQKWKVWHIKEHIRLIDNIRQTAESLVYIFCQKSEREESFVIVMFGKKIKVFIFVSVCVHLFFTFPGMWIYFWIDNLLLHQHEYELFLFTTLRECHYLNETNRHLLNYPSKIIKPIRFLLCNIYNGLKKSFKGDIFKSDCSDFLSWALHNNTRFPNIDKTSNSFCAQECCRVATWDFKYELKIL